MSDFVRAEFCRVIDFAIAQGIEAAEFLDAWRHGDTSEWPEFKVAEPGLDAPVTASKEQPIGFDKCPLSGREFWGNMDHPSLGLVALYGGPLDSYTIPALSSDGELRCERYDQDAGAWVEGGEPFAWVSEEQVTESPPVTASRAS